MKANAAMQSCVCTAWATVLQAGQMACRVHQAPPRLPAAGAPLCITATLRAPCQHTHPLPCTCTPTPAHPLMHVLPVPCR